MTLRQVQSWLPLALLLLLAACAAPDERGPSNAPPLTAEQGRARVERLLPQGVTDRAGWATDIYAALATQDIAPSVDNVCAVIAVIGQESSFQVDPVIPGLPEIARRQIERERERAGVPKLVLDAALGLTSSTGKTYAERLATVRTEQQLSDIYDDFIGKVPLGRTFLAERNPVRTAGPMQVNVGFAADYAADHPYPYPVAGSWRRELFTRRGGVYFGTAHLLAYEAPYDAMIYRFADFNAGRYASRNAAFQNAVTQASGVPLALDGDVLRYDGTRPVKEPGSTEIAVRVLAPRLRLDDESVRNDLALAHDRRFERSATYRGVFALADAAAGRPLPRAVVPRIELQSPKITRPLTTQWFAERVDGRFRACRARAQG